MPRGAAGRAAARGKEGAHYQSAPVLRTLHTLAERLRTERGRRSIARWTDAELAELRRAASAVAGMIENEEARRFDARDDAEDAAEGRRILDSL